MVEGLSPSASPHTLTPDGSTNDYHLLTKLFTDNDWVKKSEKIFCHEIDLLFIPLINSTDNETSTVIKILPEVF